MGLAMAMARLVKTAHPVTKEILLLLHEGGGENLYPLDLATTYFPSKIPINCTVNALYTK